MEDIDSDNQSMDGEYSEQDDWPIEETEEKNFWDKEILDKYAYPPSLCPCCKVGKFNIRENIKNKILHPYIIACCNKKCKKKIISESFLFFASS